MLADPPRPHVPGWFPSRSSPKSATCWGREHGSPAEAAFLRSFGRRELTLVPLTVADTDRMAALVETYASLRLGGVDASVIAVAERLNVATVATLNRRDFTVVRPRHVQALT